MSIPKPSKCESQDKFISMRTGTKDWRLLEFFTPIEHREETKEGFEPEFIIRGVAINETTTHNGHKYVASELQKASNHLIGKKLFVDHDTKVENIKGIIKNSWWNPNPPRIEFEGVVKDKSLKEMIKDGRVTDVSIGAYAKDLVKEDDGSYVAKDLEIVELSFVGVPADAKANFAMAMASNIQLKESIELEEDMKCPECGKMMKNKDELKKHMNKSHTSNEEHLSTERRFDDMTEEKTQEESNVTQKLTEDNKKLTEVLNAYKAKERKALEEDYNKLCAEKQVKSRNVSNLANEMIEVLIEQLKDVIVASPTKKEFKSVISTEEMNDLGSFMVERSGNGHAMFMMPDSKGRFNLK